MHVLQAHSGKGAPEVMVGVRGQNSCCSQTQRVKLPLTGYELQFTMCDWMQSIFDLKIFQRQKGIAQLQQLIPQSVWDDPVYYQKCRVPFFPHTQYDHVLPMGLMAIALLARGGFSEDVQRRVAYAAWLHDFASPALRDVGMRLDKEALSEERNFSAFVHAHGIKEDLAKHCNFTVQESQEWIYGGADFGPLIDVLDKISYCSLDAFHLLAAKGSHTLEQWRFMHPEALSLWMCIFIEEGRVLFGSAKMLYEFLVLRALLHTELYQNPVCRVVEHSVFYELNKLYAQGFITKEQLQEHDDAWAYEQLRTHGNCIASDMTANPSLIGWERFDSEAACKDFCTATKKIVIYREEIKPFKTGLDWLVKDGQCIKPLAQVISDDQRIFLEQLSEKRCGWFAYFYK